MQGEKTSRKTKQRNKCRKNNNKFKKLKRKKGKLYRTSKSNIEAEVYNNYKKCEGKNQLKSLIRFHSANKISNYNGAGAGGRQGERRKKERKNRKESTE